MNHLIKNLLILSLSIAFFSCNDDFVNEKLTISGVATSAIVISPEWEADDYQFSCENVVNADFTINSKPEWLILDSQSGKFTDSMATIHGSANPEPRFSNVGLYVDQMMITSDGKQYAVPVYYITEGNPTVQVNRQFEIAYNNYNNVLEISNTGEGVLLWDILSMPDWLTVNTSQFNAMSLILGKGAAATVPFVLDPKAAIQSGLTGTIILKTNDKKNPQVEIAVSANLGTPSLTFYNDRIDFGATEIHKNLGLYNSGNGLLIWSIEGLPEWLTVSPASGVYPPYSSMGEVMLTCDRSKLQAGFYSATISLKTNSTNSLSVPITVTLRVPGYNANVKALDGNIVDATFDKNTNILYYVTAQPNKLVAYDVTSKTVLHEVTLSKAPTSMAISEDFTKAAVGHGGLISAINLSDFTVTRTVVYGFPIYDIEWTKDDWFCYTKGGTYMNNMLWVNLSTLQTAESDDNEMDEGTNMKKVPQQPYVVAARRYSSPSGITVFDVNTKLEKNYRHQSIGNFWFSSDGQYMFDSSGNVYSTNAMVSANGRNPENLAAISKLKIPGTSYINNIPWMDFSSQAKSIWAISPESALIYQFEDNDYTLVKTYAYDDMYQPSAQSAAYQVVARYVFSNGSGTELSVLRKGKDNTTWSLESIAVK
ncbi:MAG TPA: hypothetical protein VGK10_10045 [Prolixibacteraceae bacterium]